jgi:hypothetical protein
LPQDFPHLIQNNKDRQTYILPISQGTRVGLNGNLVLKVHYFAIKKFFLQTFCCNLKQ